MKPDVGKIMEKTVDHMTLGRYISTDSMKSGDDFTNFGHHSGDGEYIELDKTNPIIWLVHIIPYRVGDIRVKRCWGKKCIILA